VFVILLLVTAFVTVALTYCESLIFCRRRRRQSFCFFSFFSPANQNLDRTRPKPTRDSPTRRGGPQVAVALLPLRGVDGRLRRGVLRLLLPLPVRHDRADAVRVLLRLLRRLLLGPRGDAGLGRVEGEFELRERDVQGDQERVKRRGGGRGEEFFLTFLLPSLESEKERRRKKELFPFFCLLYPKSLQEQRKHTPKKERKW